MKFMRIAAAAVSAVFLALISPAALAQTFLPGVAYDPAIPTIEAVLGKPSGERITPAADVVRYFRELEKAAPDRIKVTPYAKSWQGRELVYVVIGLAEHIKGLDGFSADMKALADPRRTSQAAANAIIARTPGSVWLAHGVHGDEISSSDAAMMTAYHLLAAKNDPTVTRILADTMVFIDPVQNPDGRDRFLNGFYDTTGLVPSGSPIAAERVQPWPGGRYNHYLFDMNRDWLSITQPETVGRIAIFQDWFPLVFVDLHEMGSNSSYFFSPEADPYNPDITPSQRNALKLIGRNNARWFDRFGFSYFTREVYDAFYPGYGAAWPLFHGSIGTTYEQASARGLLARQSDGNDMSYQDTVRHHFTSSIATLETMSANREKMLRDFYAYRASAIDEGRKGKIRSYVVPPQQQDQSTADRLAKLLDQHGIEVSRATDTFRACGKTYPAGSYAISLAQPAGRLLRTLMEPQVDLDKTFMAEQERRRAKDLEAELYDVTAWSLPLMFNVTTDRCADDATGALATYTMNTPTPGAFTNPDATYGFVAPWGSTSSARLLAAALRAGIAVSSSDFAFTHAGVAYPSGTLIFRSTDTPDLAAKLQRLATDTGANITGVDDSWITDGPSFGSERVATHKAPRIAIAWDRPVSATSAGNLRFVVERQLGYPVTPVRVANLGADELSQFDVLILPDGNYGSALGDGAALKGWTERGGVLIAIGSASRFVADPKTGLSSLRRENAVRKDEPKDKKDDKATVPGTEFTSAADLLAAELPLEEAPDASPGALVKATPDADHWLSAGLKPSLNVLMTGNDIFTPIRRDAGVNVISFAGPKDLVTSGYLWEDTKRQLAYKPFVVVEPKGRGQLITFTQNPTVRAYLDGLNVLLANAIFRGAAHAKPPR